MPHEEIGSRRGLDAAAAFRAISDTLEHRGSSRGVESFFLSFFLGWRRPNLISRLSGLCASIELIS